MFSKIIGTGTGLPERSYSNSELAALHGIDTTDEWIVSRSGIKSRYLAAPGQLSSDLGAVAAQNALQAAGVHAQDIDLVLCATTTPDMVFPSTACIIQDKLGIKKGAAYDVQAVCTGFVYALATADAMIKNGLAKTALVVAAETYSRILNWQDRGTCVLFGDGAAAVVLSTSTTPGILACDLNADGSQRHMLSVPGWVNTGKVEGSPLLQMDGQAVFKFAVAKMAETAKTSLSKAKASESDIDYLIPHQANIRIMEATGKKLGLAPDKLIATVDHHGNTSAASIPLALDESVRAGKIKSGDHLMLVGVGGGFTWGSVYCIF
ncbi:MAG: beta-ketoacyl-ACP synthase [Pseudomonadota bacterium]|jgi:3-oxoacyl-[acyl-carrier-protein] synthase-3